MPTLLQPQKARFSRQVSPAGNAEAAARSPRGIRADLKTRQLSNGNEGVIALVRRRSFTLEVELFQIDFEPVGAHFGFLVEAAVETLVDALVNTTQMQAERSSQCLALA